MAFNTKKGTVEHKDANGDVIRTEEGLIIGRGDNKRVITDKEVLDLARLHCTYKEIADFFDLPVETLKYQFRDLIIKGKEETKQALRKAQLKAALSGNVTMLIWLGKNILGQEETPTNIDNTEPLPWLNDK
jgi:hypothetical protein